MKKIILTLSCAVVLFVAVLLLAGLQKPEPNVPEPPSSNILSYSTANKNSSQENNGISMDRSLSSSQSIYIIREYNGEIGVFAENQDSPLLLVEVLVKTLPEADQKMLESGITVRGDENLNSILEDYES